MIMTGKCPHDEVYYHLVPNSIDIEEGSHVTAIFEVVCENCQETIRTVKQVFKFEYEENI